MTFSFGKGEASLIFAMIEILVKKIFPKTAKKNCCRKGMITKQDVGCHHGKCSTKLYLSIIIFNVLFFLEICDKLPMKLGSLLLDLHVIVLWEFKASFFWFPSNSYGVTLKYSHNVWMECKTHFRFFFFFSISILNV